MDALREYMTMGVGQAASTLNTMLGMHVELEVPEISLMKATESEGVSEDGDTEFATVTIKFDGNIKGNASVVFDTKSATRLFEMLMPGTPPNLAEMDEISESTLVEVGNIVINSIMGSISNTFDFELDYEVPRYQDATVSQLHSTNEEPGEPKILFADTFNIGEGVEVQGKILLFYGLADLKQLMDQWQEPGSAE